MLTLITTILCVVCYCCHRNIKKRTEAAYRQQRQWLENDPNMEIYSVEQCYETSGLFVGDSMDGLATIPALHHEPPPSYDAVVAMQEQQQLLIQQHQQQLLMQQQLLQQQLPTNNSPPPGYRSSLDVSSIIQGRVSALGGVLGVGGSIISGMEINSLASSDANIRTATSHSPIDPLLNYNDVNGNMTNALTVATTTPTNNRASVSYLRNKQQQQQRNVGPNQLSQLNMKKVLQAQSCCSLQRAEVENMWNAAAAALAARSAHLTSESRASTTASTSSPTLAMNARKLSQGYNTSKSNTPETFGSRYLKQNYYRRGCPLCGKFRYDNDSILSISMESNLDTLAGALAEEQSTTNGQERNSESTQNNLNNNDNLANNLNEKQQQNANEYGNETEDNEAADMEDEHDDNDNDIEQQCSCANTKRKFKQQNHYQKLNTQQDNGEEIETSLQQVEISVPELIHNREDDNTTTDANANCAIATARQSTTTTTTTTNQDPTNNNNNNDILEDSLPSTSAATAITNPHNPNTVATSTSASTASTPASVTINLDCINENGIISLDMSKIIDKTGLPTYDAALKLESSGYV
ncbi:putative uncharacterized protein DDB_G0289963 [Lucilia cuprina]|uniref:putative uncharacterized protein DDB_G0289963 n=1 Tax=Lucilia cuprina TaxID=7375 RepID=UPI001F07059F|nr:putative uncharacterized protein DDB_G0289963 [Lucilia cuprina]